jgi:hypothetical protein
MNKPERNCWVNVLRIFRVPATVFPLGKKWAREASIDGVWDTSVIRTRDKDF